MANEYLKRTPTSSGNRKVWTWSGWVKFVDIDKNDQVIYSAVFGSSYIHLRFMGVDATASRSYKLNFQLYDGSTSYNIYTDRVIRDCGSWYHLVLSVDYTQSAEADRTKIYINNELTNQVDAAGTGSATIAAQDADTFANLSGAVNNIGYHSTYGEYASCNIFDVLFVDGQALTPDVFGFYKDGDGYVSAGSSIATDFRPGQWVPHAPRVIKKSIERNGGFGANGFYLPMNDSSNPGADFHCTPNSIITLKGEDLPQPQNGAPTTSDAYVSQLRQEVGSLGFDGVASFDGSGDYLSIPKASFQMLHKLTSSWTVEGYIFKTADAQGTIFDTGGSSSSTIGTAVYINSGGNLRLTVRQATGGTVVNESFPGSVALNRWQHIAVSYDGTSIRIFVEGILLKTVSYNTQSSTDSSANFNIGVYDAVGGGGLAGYFNGFISNLRVIDGTALYTTNFTAPTEALTNVTNTTLLCCNSSTSATASTVTPGTITANGDVFATRNELTGSIVLAVAGISTATGANLVTNGHFDANTTGWTAVDATLTWAQGRVQTNRTGGSGLTAYQAITVESGKRYTVSGIVDSTGSGNRQDLRVLDDLATNGASALVNAQGTNNEIVQVNGSFTATGTTHYVYFASDSGGTGAFSDIVVKQEDAPRDYSADIKGSGSNKTLTPINHAGVGYDLGGYYGSAINVDGDTSDAFSYSVPNNDPLFLQGNFTVELWAKIASGITDDRYFVTLISGGSLNSQSSWYFRINSSKYEGIFVNGNTQYKTISANNYVADQWNHIVYEREGNVQKLFINGVCESVTTHSVLPNINSSSLLYIGSSWNLNNPLTAEIQDVRIYDGVAKYKGGFDVPKPYAPGNFVSDNYRNTADTCKNNFATLNPLLGIGRQDQLTYSEGNLRVVSAATSGSDTTAAANTAFKGKIYCEFYLPISAVGAYVGLMKYNTNLTNSGTDTTASSDCWIVRGDNGNKANGESGSGVSYGSAFASGDVIMMAVDIDNTSIWWGKNGTWFDSGNPAANTNAGYTNLPSTEDLLAICGDNFSSETPHIIANFGQNPAFSGTLTAGTNADGNGKGLFKYAPPSGFLALCEDNLPTPAIADPGDHFKCMLYTGDGNAGLNVSGVGFQPDMVWIKNRDSARSHNIYDSVRGAAKRIQPDLTNIESDVAGVSAFNSNGFSLGNGTDDANFTAGENYVAWCWKAGGASIQNTDGSTTAQISANPTAGFSIVSYPGTAANATIGHGLGKVPKWILVKERGSSANNWPSYHAGTGNTKALYLDLTNAQGGDFAGAWNNTTPNATTFTVGTSNETNRNGSNFIAYCWAEIEGFSKFGSYEGNNNADGPFIYCGFKPAWIMFKGIDSVTNWVIVDSSRDSVNSAYNDILFPDANVAANTGANKYLDFVSNGFKLRGTSGAVNAAETYVFMAFAESPFQNANAK